MPLSGEDMLKRFLKAGWSVLRQRGSHVVIGKNSARQVIPMHRELKKGLERSLLKTLSEDK